MKKSIVAFAILGAFASAASAQSSIVFYGIVDASVTHSTNNKSAVGTRGENKLAVENGQLQSSRWGFKGSEDLGNGLKANFRLESSLGADTGTAGNGSTLFDRNATVGLTSKEIGSVDLGRQNNLIYETLNAADPMNGAFYSTANPNSKFGFLAGTQYDTFGTNKAATNAQRQNNSVKYTSNNYSGFTVGAMYGFGEKAGDATSNQYTGLSLNYSAGDIQAYFSASQFNNTNSMSRVRSLAGGAKFKVMSDYTVKLTYTTNSGNLDGRTYSVFGTGVDYAIAADTTLTGAAYLTNVSGTNYKARAGQVAVIAKYALSKRTSAYAGFNYGRGTPSASTFIEANRSATRTTVGVNHAF